MHILRSPSGIALAATVLALLVSDAPAFAQVGTDVLARQSLRPYWYVFIAYALAWLLLMGWLLSIGRRIRRLEDAGAGQDGRPG